MKLDEIVAWYQKKISTYDKQQWEKTVEQRILNGFVHVPLKNTKLKTELIDVDLVRGSSFPKAKPKQTLLTVFRLAVLRLFLLPIYAKWWVQQTSPKIFTFLLALYVLQLFNWGIYSYNIRRTESDTEHSVSITDLIIPNALSFLLSIIHSQIVATACTTRNSKGKLSLHPRKKKREQNRRKKKVTRVRSNYDVKPNVSNDNSDSVYGLKQNFKLIKLSNRPLNIIPNTEKTSTNELPINNSENDIRMNCDKHNIQRSSSAESPTGLRKRNVNWNVPIRNKVLTKNYVGGIDIKNVNIPDEGTGIKEVNIATGGNDNTDMNIPTGLNVINDVNKQAGRNDIKDVNIPTLSELKSEIDSEMFYNVGLQEAIRRTVRDRYENVDRRELLIDDDGFESLNGKSSSGEDNMTLLSSLITATKEEHNIDSDKDRDTRLGISEDSSKTHLNRSRLGNSPLNCEVLSGPSASTSQKHTKPLQFEPQTKDQFFKKNFYNSGEDSTDTYEEGDDDVQSSNTNPQFTEATTSATEWIGITTNSEECSYSSQYDYDSQFDNSENGGEYDFAAAYILNPGNTTDRINCTIWHRKEAKKAEMSVLDISSVIIDKVEAMPETCDYIYIGLLFSILLSLVPPFCRLCEATLNATNSSGVNIFDMPVILFENASFSCVTIMKYAFGNEVWEKLVLSIGFLVRFCLTFLFFFLLTVAERTFKQRFLYAKLFSHLTSSRRARKSEVPHFRLNKVRNIKTWLSVRSYLKRRGPQRSVDVIVSAAFILALLLLAFLSAEWLKDSVYLHSQYNIEALIWSCALGCFLLRFMTLGTKIHRKYRSISVLITEQINLYLQIEQKPQKKEELMVSNSVLKLAADLLKELESPFKISGLNANPYLYTTVKVVILSALSGVLSEMLGFKLKLLKIQIK